VNQRTGIKLSTKLCLSSAASSGCESLVIVIFLPLRCFSSVVFLLENPAREQQKCASLRLDLLERRTGQIERAVQIERAQAFAFLLEAKLTSLSFFTLVTQFCSTQQKPPVSANSSVLIYCDWCFGCYDFQVLVWIVAGGQPVLILSHRSKRFEVS
jgi:hypothetical protein